MDERASVCVRAYVRVCVRACVRVCVLSHVSLCNAMDYSPPGASVHGILQARILEWVAMHSSRGTCPPGVKPASPAWAGGSSPSEPSRKPSPGGASAALKRGRGSGGHGEVGDGRCEGLEPPLLAVKMEEGTRVQRMPEAS